jgi:hypothetical protein
MKNRTISIWEAKHPLYQIHYLGKINNHITFAITHHDTKTPLGYVSRRYDMCLMPKLEKLVRQVRTVLFHT